MISLIISILAGFGVYEILVATTDQLPHVWCVIFGALTVLASQLIFGLFFRKKINAVTEAIQQVIAEGQQKIQRKANMFQTKPAGGIKHMQKLLEKDQEKSIREALELTKRMEPLWKWSLLLKKQTDTMRMQFHYQLGEFKEVDALLPNCLFMEPLAMAMKMARQYKNNDPALEKTFKSKKRKFKGDDGVIIHALYSWILLKRGDADSALKVLTDAKEWTSDETILKNWEALA
ncbi:MAG: hypothetical protein GXP32_06840, partial [Kiritimatiellaeota bacterium]|nr:hypothetical protein [Kiritimatiellota bacterium]